MSLTESQILKHGYEVARNVPRVGWCATLPLLFTHDLFVGLNERGYKKRYCYEYREEALVALALWEGAGDPPGPWIKEQPSGRLGPGATEERDDNNYY